MNKIPYIILGVLLIGAIIMVSLTKNSQNETPELVQIPPSISPQITSSQIGTGSSEILGEESATIPDVSTAIIETTKGSIKITLFPDAAPNTVANFAEKAKNGFYNGLTFHRVEDWVVQGGDPLGNGTGGGQMPTELNNNPFIRGSVGVARGGDINISNASQFFITKTDANWLDSQYANFGQVDAESMAVVEALQIGDTVKSITIE